MHNINRIINSLQVLQENTKKDFIKTKENIKNLAQDGNRFTEIMYLVDDLKLSKKALELIDEVKCSLISSLTKGI